MSSPIEIKLLDALRRHVPLDMDRELLLIGIPTMRFTGSEIVHSAERCAADVYAMAAVLQEKENEGQFMWREATLAAERRAASPTTKEDV